MSIQRFLFTVFSCTCLLVPGMFASTITETCTPTVPTTQPISYNLDCTIAAFNTSLGTLTGVTLTLSNVGGEVIPEQTNTSAGALGFTNSAATLYLSYTEVGLGTPLVFVTPESNACAGTVNADSTNTTCAPTDFSNLGSGPVADPNLTYYETGSTVTLVGSGGLDGASGDGVFGQPSAGVLSFGGDGTIGGQLTVTYDYTPEGSLPEPTTMALLGGGLLGLAAIIRKHLA